MDTPIKQTTIKGITRRIIKQATDMGYDVYVSYSQKSKSRYLEIRVHKTDIWLVRISDHPPVKERHYTFDIYTDTPRTGAVDYRGFLNALNRINDNLSKEQL